MGQIPDSPAGFSRSRNLRSGSTLGAALVTIDLVKGKKCSYSPFLSSFALVFLLLLLTVRGTESPLLPQLTQASFVSPPVSPTAPALPSARAGSVLHFYPRAVLLSAQAVQKQKGKEGAHPPPCILPICSQQTGLQAALRAVTAPISLQNAEFSDGTSCPGAAPSTGWLRLFGSPCGFCVFVSEKHKGTCLTRRAG